jgi:hypothetical protein
MLRALRVVVVALFGVLASCGGGAPPPHTHLPVDSPLRPWTPPPEAAIDAGPASAPVAP